MRVWNRSTGATGLGSEEDEKIGQVAFAAAGGIFLGWFLAWAYLRSQGKKKV